MAEEIAPPGTPADLPERSPAERKRAILDKLEDKGKEVWVASANEAGEAFLVTLSYSWDGSRLTVGTGRATKTARNLARVGFAQVALPDTRDVLILDGTVEMIPFGSDPELDDAHTRTIGLDPTTLPNPEEWVNIRITPRRIQAFRWGEGGRSVVMRGGEWLI